VQAQRKLLSGQRWHFQHGPIDLVISAHGDSGAIEIAHNAAWERFNQVLPELAFELTQLQMAVNSNHLHCPLEGLVAKRMWQACQPFSVDFITPMAAVAGAVAQEIISYYQHPDIQRAWVNNGGDIALHLSPGQSLRVGLYANMAQLNATQLENGLELDGYFSVNASMPVRGLATSGWRGRSFSFGIADSVTVLAGTASQADAAATVIANAVNVKDSRVLRVPASSRKDRSDLGDRLVTVDVPLLEQALVEQALQAGLTKAQTLHATGLIFSAALVCQGQVLVTSNNVLRGIQPACHNLALA